jgi:sulfonate transport system permease protein
MFEDQTTEDLDLPRQGSLERSGSFLFLKQRRKWKRMSVGNFTLVEGKVLSATAERRVSAGHRWVSAKARFKPVFVRWGERGIGMILPITILLAWELVARLHWVKPVFLPSPWEVVTSFYDMLVNQGLLTDFRVSATAVIQGFLIGSVLGLFTGIAAGLSKTMERFLGPTLNSLRQVPTLAWLPLIVLWIGAGTFAKSVIIGKAVFFPVFLNTLQGIRGVSKEYIEVARIFEYKKGQLLRKVILPAALPSIFVGIRYGAGLAWAFVIAAEMLGGRYGLGYLLMRSQELLLTGQLFVVIIVIGAVGFGVDVGLRRIESSLLRWKKRFEG